LPAVVRHAPALDPRTGARAPVERERALRLAADVPPASGAGVGDPVGPDDRHGERSAVHVGAGEDRSVDVRGELHEVQQLGDAVLHIGLLSVFTVWCGWSPVAPTPPGRGVGRRTPGRGCRPAGVGSATSSASSWWPPATTG